MTLEELRSRLDYDPISGVFTWKIGKKKGKQAGCVFTCGYRMIKFSGGERHYAHRLAWLYIHGKWPDHHIDHVDHDRDNNSRKNLRDVPRAVNYKNKSKPKNNSSGIVGVTWYALSRKWRAQIKVDGTVINLGCSTRKREAARLRKEAEKKYGFHRNHGVAR